RFLIAVAVVAAAQAGPGAIVLRAETPGFEDFSFRRVKPPESGVPRRITVQIDPAEQARRLAASPKVTPRAEEQLAVAEPPPLPALMPGAGMPTP
ncbi:hypothetical protein, partial [Gulbenkiania mobilis]|uniref:hypothetical protein n=1 Tax=Gulbenkiania mobilis TaxID=397457 RepID=UPI0019107AF6